VSSARPPPTVITHRDLDNKNQLRGEEVNKKHIKGISFTREREVDVCGEATATGSRLARDPDHKGAYLSASEGKVK